VAGILPAIFFGHGNPMNAVSSNAYTGACQCVGGELQRPGIVSISAHWFVPQTGVTIGIAALTIHDFGGLARLTHSAAWPAR
jgi:4,5-DOPA dioxygenase extradiol